MQKIIVLLLPYYLLTFNTTIGVEPGKEKRPPAPPQEAVKPVQAPPIQAPLVSPPFTHPGILVLKNGVWEGSDYLFNLKNQLGVAVDIYKPENVMSELTNAKLQAFVEENLRKGGIIPTSTPEPGEPLLPLFHVQILIYPVGKGYSIACEGSLFESATVKRVILDPGTVLQVITWQRQKLIVVAEEGAAAHIEKSVGDIIQSFIDLFQLYHRNSK